MRSITIKRFVPRGPYISAFRALINSEGVKRVVDLGCGDFEVARRILSPELIYVGCDVVPGLVARNEARFATEHIEFRNLDVVTDPLPEGDLCIIRQVFQQPLEWRYRYRPAKSEAVSAGSGHRRASRR
jgi:SAM-dependent methyltransferase